MHCSVCGAAGHRVESCLLPGARLVKRLRQQLKEGTAAPKPDKFKDDRNHASKGRKHKRQRGSSTKALKARQTNALAGLWAMRCLRAKTMMNQWNGSARPALCECGGKGLQGPWSSVRKGRRPWWFWRCPRWQCQKRVPFLDATPWCGLQVSPTTLARLLCQYASADLMKPLRLDDMVQSSHISQKQAWHFLSTCTELESEAGAKYSSQQTLTGCIEADCTGLGRFWVSLSNALYADQLQKVQKKKGRQYKAYPCFVRILGMKQRDGSFIRKFLRPKARVRLTYIGLQHVLLVNV